MTFFNKPGKTRKSFYASHGRGIRIAVSRLVAGVRWGAFFRISVFHESSQRVRGLVMVFLTCARLGLVNRNV